MLQERLEEVNGKIRSISPYVKVLSQSAGGGLVVLAGTSLAPVALKVAGFALFTAEGLLVTSGIALTSTIGTFLYCYNKGISYEDFKEGVKQFVQKAIHMITALAVINKVKEIDVNSVVSELKNALVNANNETQAPQVSSVLPSLGGQLVGYGMEKIAGKAGIDANNSQQMSDGATGIASALSAYAIGANPVSAVLSTQVGRLVSDISGGVVNKEVATAIGAMTTLGGEKALDQVVAKLPMLAASANYSTTNFVVRGADDIFGALLKHNKIEHSGQIKDGFSIMMTTAVASGLGADPYMAFLGFELSKATSSGVQKLAVLTNIPDIQAKRIGDIAGTMATPVFSIAADAMAKFFQLSTSPLESITYGAGIAAEGFFKQTKYKANAGNIGLGTSAITSLGGAAITGLDPLTLVFGAMLNHMFRSTVKKAAVAVKCKEETAETISIVAGAIAVPVMGSVATQAAIEHPTQAMMGIAVVGVYAAYQNNLHGYVANVAMENVIKPVANAAVKYAERQSIDRGFLPDGYGHYKFGTPERAQEIWRKNWEDMENSKRAMRYESEKLERILTRPSTPSFPIFNINPKINYGLKFDKVPSMPKFNSPFGGK